MKQKGAVQIDREGAETEDEIVIEILNHHKPMPHLSIDCKDLYEYNKQTTNKSKVFTRPYLLKYGDLITIKRGNPLIIIKNPENTK